MKRIIERPLWITLLAIAMSGVHHSPFSSRYLEGELEDLTRRGFTYRFVEENRIELTDPVSGSRSIKSLDEPSEAAIKGWADSRGIPILEINPNTIDTSQYTGWYTYWTQVPLSDGEGIPLTIGDANRNGNPEVYGVYQDFTYWDYQARVYEIDTSSGIVSHRYTYNPYPGVSKYMLDADRDSLGEVMFSFSGVVSDFEQLSQNSLPTVLRFQFDRYHNGVSPGRTGIYFGSLDGDSLTDFLYKGAGPDSSDTARTLQKVYVAEYDPQVNNFVRVCSTQYAQGERLYIGGFAVGDFDQDGAMEFVATDLFTGGVFLAENLGDNNYVQTWHDGTGFVNLYYMCSGDVDNDGRPEFVVGATLSSGNWTTVYEADSNDHYSAKFIFHLLSGGTLDEPTYLTTDVDGNGTAELIIMSGRDLYVFRGIGNDNYALWYLKREDRKDAVQFYDFNGDSRQDFIISKLEIDSLGRGRNYADAYRATSLVRVSRTEGQPNELRLLQNYPNPFNPSTVISFELPSSSFVALKVYDVLGREIATLAKKEMLPGSYEATFNGARLPSGVYLVRLETENSAITRKMLLLK